MGANIVNATDASFENDVLKSDIPVVVDFWAVWCGPCKAIAPHLEALANEKSGRIKIVKVDVDNSPGVAMKYNVRSIPTLLLVKDGQVLGAVGVSGVKSTEDAQIARAAPMAA